MALLLWIYFSGCVFTFGACLCAGQAKRSDNRQRDELKENTGAL